MSRVLVWIRRAVVTAVALVVVVVTAVYAGSEGVRRRTYDIPLSPVATAGEGEADLVEGGRTARILGCYGGCHGTQLEGRLFFSEPGVADLVAPNLTRAAAAYSDGELARAIRHGVRRDGTGLFVMPSNAFFHLSDADLRDLIAFLRRQPRTEGYAGTTTIGPVGRIGIVTGRFKPMPALMDHSAPRVPPGDAGDPMARGRYLARVACAECHGDTLRGGLDGRAPSLAIAAAYTDEAFRRLLRTGESLGKRDLYIMDDAARSRFTHLTDAEISALHTYLRSFAAGTR